MQLDSKIISPFLHEKVMACLEFYLQQANHAFNVQFIQPKISYKRKGSIAGSAFLQRWEIQLNLDMLIENELPFIDEVLPHELAHLIAFKQYGNVKPHGKEWQHIMANVFNLLPKRTHNFANTSNQFVYYCQCQKHYLSKIRHNKFQKNIQQYLCSKCGTLLQFREMD